MSNPKMIVAKIGNKFPKTCDKCPLFVDGILGQDAFCILEAEYTDEEIDKEPDGNLNMYYHGCLTHRPKSCPLVELKEGGKR